MRLIILLICLTLCCSCMNRYEKLLIGNYEVSSFEKTDEKENSFIDLPKLKLYRNKTFTLAFKSSTIKGDWKADDYGDFTIVEFEIDNNQAQGKLLGSDTNPEIEMLIPSAFYCPFLKSLVFKQK